MSVQRLTGISGESGSRAEARPTVETRVSKWCLMAVGMLAVAGAVTLFLTAIDEPVDAAWLLVVAVALLGTAIKIFVFFIIGPKPNILGALLSSPPERWFTAWRDHSVTKRDVGSASDRE
jgi:hypothetical protein